VRKNGRQGIDEVIRNKGARNPEIGMRIDLRKFISGANIRQQRCD